MKSMRYLLAISLLLLPILASACWHPWTLYNNTTLFRLDATEGEKRNIRETNCRHWQNLTNREIPLSDIEYVVYTMPLEEYEAFCAADNCMSNNAFAQWIKRNDSDIVEFLLLAKRNEEIRFKYISKWYYPTMKVGGPVSLDEIVDVALASDSERLRDRYLLQAVRAMTTLKRYDECLELWDREISLLPEDNFMRRLCREYIAGAYYHTGDVDKAMMMFASYGDTGSMRYIADKEDMELTTYDIINYSYRSGAPFSKYAGYIRDMIVDAETYPNVYNMGDKPVVTDEIISVRNLAIEAGNNPRCADRAEWLYIAAYIYTQQGNYATAKSYVAKAETLPASDKMKESIEVLKVYLDALTSTYNAAYESRLFEQIKWFDENLRKELAARQINYSYYWTDFSCNYWFTSMIRIFSYTTATRYFEAGNPVRALQLLNFNEYIPYKHVPYICYGYYIYYDGYDDYDYNSCMAGLDEYRSERRVFNNIDYSSWFFEKFDEQTPDAAIAYVERALNPKSEFDRYLNDVGYTSSDFLYDVVGTLCLRHMRYQEAEYYFSLVSLDYQYKLNVCLNKDPFDSLCIEGERVVDFRYRFASTMAALERGIESATDPNRRAQLLLKYGVGMGNSVKSCWPLTRYGCNCDTPWDDDPITLEVHAKAINCINEAMVTFTDDEFLADAHYSLGHLHTVVKDFGNTERADFVRRHCDNYMDYVPNLFMK